MSKRTENEIAAEVAVLQALNPVGLFARKTAESIQIQIDALQGRIDETSAEFAVELSEENQMVAMDAINWRDGMSKVQPSKDWGRLIT